MTASGNGWRILHGDVIERLRDLPSGHFHCCVTSPPYWGLRDYGVDGVPDRVIESYAVPVAMLVAAGVGDVSWGRKWLEKTTGNRDFAEVSMTDQQELIDSILEGFVTLGRDRATVAEILSGDISDSNITGIIRAMEGLGITRASKNMGSARREHIPFECRDTIFINHRSVGRNFLRGTKWENQSLDQLLLRIPGAERAQRKMSSKSVRGIDIPAKSIDLDSDKEF